MKVHRRETGIRCRYALADSRGNRALVHDLGALELAEGRAAPGSSPESFIRFHRIAAGDERNRLTTKRVPPVSILRPGNQIADSLPQLPSAPSLPCSLAPLLPRSLAPCFSLLRSRRVRRLFIVARIFHQHRRARNEIVADLVLARGMKADAQRLTLPIGQSARGAGRTPGIEGCKLLGQHRLAHG